MTWIEKLNKNQKDKEREELKEYLQIILTLEKVNNNLYSITAQRQDYITHSVIYSPWIFPTRALANARKRLISEIELITGKPTYIVTKFITYDS